MSKVVELKKNLIDNKDFGPFVSNFFLNCQSQIKQKQEKREDILSLDDIKEYITLLDEIENLELKISQIEGGIKIVEDKRIDMSVKNSIEKTEKILKKDIKKNIEKDKEISKKIIDDIIVEKDTTNLIKKQEKIEEKIKEEKKELKEEKKYQYAEDLKKRVKEEMDKRRTQFFNTFPQSDKETAEKKWMEHNSNFGIIDKVIQLKAKEIREENGEEIKVEESEEESEEEKSGKEESGEENSGEFFNMLMESYNGNDIMNIKRKEQIFLYYLVEDINNICIAFINMFNQNEKKITSLPNINNLDDNFKNEIRKLQEFEKKTFKDSLDVLREKRKREGGEEESNKEQKTESIEAKPLKYKDKLEYIETEKDKNPLNPFGLSYLEVVLRKVFNEGNNLKMYTRKFISYLIELGVYACKAYKWAGILGMHSKSGDGFVFIGGYVVMKVVNSFQDFYRCLNTLKGIRNNESYDFTERNNIINDEYKNYFETLVSKDTTFGIFGFAYKFYFNLSQTNSPSSVIDNKYSSDFKKFFKTLFKKKEITYELTTTPVEWKVWLGKSLNEGKEEEKKVECHNKKHKEKGEDDDLSDWESN